MPEKVCIVGSGNWGSAIARIVGACAKQHDDFDTSVNMWVFEEQIEQPDGSKKALTEIINDTHVNVKYLPDATLPDNIKAVPDLAEAAKDATILIFVLPHQFLKRICPTIKGACAAGCKAISLIKGIEFENSKPLLISDMIKAEMGGMDVSVLMGANVANEVAMDQFCEATIGVTSAANGPPLKKLFHTGCFQITVVSDVPGVELCGALKNVVALGAGYCDGLGFGGNTKAAIIRIGLKEMQKFCSLYYGEVVQASTFFESCGLADLVTTCFGGRNAKCAAAFAEGKGAKSWDSIETEMLNGQKLQGTITAKDVYTCLSAKLGSDEKILAEFPLFARVHAIGFQGMAAAEIVKL